MRTAAATFIGWDQHHRASRDGSRRGAAGDSAFQTCLQIFDRIRRFDGKVHVGGQLVIGLFFDEHFAFVARQFQQFIESDWLDAEKNSKYRQGR